MPYELTNDAQRAAVRSALRLRAAPILIGSDGDSRVDAYSDVTATTKTKYNRGVGYWLEFLTKGRVRFPASLNFGINNETSAGLLNRIDTSIAAWVAAGVSAAVLMIGTNDPGAGISSASTASNYAEIERRIVNAGIQTIWLGELPRGDGSSLALSGTNLRYHVENDRWQRDRVGRDMVFSVSAWSRFADRSSIANAAAGYANTSYLYDKLHPNAAGAYQIAKAALPLFQHLFGPVPAVRENAADVYDAVYSPKGAITVNPYMILGTGGSDQATSSPDAFTGTLPQYWIAKNYPGSGSSVVCAGSLVTDSAGDSWWQLAFSGTAGTGSDSFMFYQDTNVGTSGVAVGTPYKASGALQMDAAQTGVAALDVFLRDQSSTFFARSGIGLSSSDNFPVDALDGYAETDEVPLPAASTSMRTGLAVNFKPGAVVSATVRFRNLFSRAA